MNDLLSLPPQNREAEEALIGAVLIDPKILPSVSFVKSIDFYYDVHRWIWDALLRCAEDDIDIDIVTIQYRLESDGKLEQAGGPAYFARLLNSTPTSLHAVEYANIIRDLAYRRKLSELAAELAGAAYNPTRDPSTIISSISDVMKIRFNGSKPTSWAESVNMIKKISWSWQPWLPNGMVTILAAESGKGKSQLALRVAASHTQGDPLPDGSPFTGKTGKVLWCESEAAQAIHMDRAQNWGLSLDNFLNLVDGEKSIDFESNNLDHRNILKVRSQNPEVRLIVIDSLSGSTGGKHEQDSEMLELMKFLAGLARDIDKPILITHHLRKKGILDIAGVNLERLRGSSSIVQVSRVVWTIDEPDPNASGWLRLQVIKNNLAKFPNPIGMLIGEKGIRFGLAPEPPKVETVADKAADLLMALLGDEPLSYRKIEEEFNGAGISEASINRAKKRLGVVAVKHPDGWFWSLPARGSYDN